LAAAFVKANLIRESDRAQVIESLRDRLASRLQRGKSIKNLDANTVQRDIAKSVNRVAADLGRPPVVIAPERLAEQTLTPKPLVRDDAQVR
jgi:predicted kinase